MNASTLIRRVHLACAFTLLAFVVMYFATGYVLTHGPWFGEATETVTRRTATRPQSRGGSPGTAPDAAALKAELALRGQASRVERRRDGSWRVSYFHPGHLTEVTVTDNPPGVEVVERRFGWQRVLVGLHRLHGYRGGPLYVIWAVCFDLASASMIVFAVTGLLLWHRTVRDRRPGWVILGAGFALTLSTIGYFLIRQ